MYILQAHGDLVSAVDFGAEFLVAGFEDGSLGVWSLQPIGKVFLFIIITPVCVAREPANGKASMNETWIS
jgi:hypothetical protein